MSQEMLSPQESRMCVDLSHLWKIQNERCLLNSIFIFFKKKSGKRAQSSAEFKAVTAAIPSFAVKSSVVWELQSKHV